MQKPKRRRNPHARHPNILLIAIDSLRADHMSCYGYSRHTTPHIDRFSLGGTIFQQTYSPHIPTTSAYASMLTGCDCFDTQVVALRHKGGMTTKVKTLPEILRRHGYSSCCVGFTGNAASRGFDEYLNHDEVWGTWSQRPLHKAERLNEVAQPKIEQLHREGKPWLMLLRHMDPHAPYLPPPPYDRMFYHGNEFDRHNRSMKPVFDFKPFRDFHASFLPPGITDKDYVIAQYDGAVAYMDACLQQIFTQLEAMKILDNTIVVINGDHGETLYDHGCWFDHHGLYDVTLHVPLIIRYPQRIPAGLRLNGFNQHKDLVPTLLELAGIKTRRQFEGRSLTGLIGGKPANYDSEFYITECTWMRKHGWRTPQWKFIIALEPDFHYMPKRELYDLVQDPDENENIAQQNPDVVKMLEKRMARFIRKRQTHTGSLNPMMTQGAWAPGAPFKSSRTAYNTLHIGGPKQANKLQAGKS